MPHLTFAQSLLLAYFLAAVFIAGRWYGFYVRARHPVAVYVGR